MKEDLVSSSQMSTMAMFNTLKTVDLFQPHVIFHYVTNMWYFIRACFTQKDETVANILQIKLLENMEWMMTDEKMLNVLDEDEDVNQLIDSFFMRRVKSSKEWMKQLSITKEQMDDQPLQIHWMKVDLFLWKKHFQKHEISDNTPARKIVVKENSIFRRDDMKKIQSFYAYSLVLMGVTPDLWDEYRRKYLYFGKNFRVEKGMLMIGEKLNDLPTTTVKIFLFFRISLLISFLIGIESFIGNSSRSHQEIQSQFQKNLRRRQDNQNIRFSTRRTTKEKIEDYQNKDQK